MFTLLLPVDSGGRGDNLAIPSKSYSSDSKINMILLNQKFTKYIKIYLDIH